MLPAIFVSHGAPTLAIEPGPTHDFLKILGAEMEKPAAIVVVSAHWEAVRPTLSTVAQPETIHDFYGFPEELYRMRYAVPGAVEVAAHGSQQQSLPTEATAPAAVPPTSTNDLRGAVNAYEKALLEEALAKNRFNQRTTATALGLTYDQLRHAMKRHQLAVSN